MHPEAHAFVRLSLGELSVCEFGSFNVNGSVRDLFAGWNYLGVDRVAGPGVDVVADAATFAPAQRFDVIVTTEALEHAENWREIVANAARLLKPGGLFIGTAAGPGRAAHNCNGSTPDGKEHYENIDPVALRAAMTASGFEEVRIELRATDIRWTGRTPRNSA